MGELSREQLSALESELRYTKENLQATIEELETSNEELQATNEELVASNEELQSTNEELQSVNEELYTVNAEYQKKIAQLTELTNDMDNLLASTEVGTIFLDRELRIRRFTPKLAETFNLLPHDVGRPIEDFTNNLEYRGLLEDLGLVLASGQSVEREVSDRQGPLVFDADPALPRPFAGRGRGAHVDRYRQHESGSGCAVSGAALARQPDGHRSRCDLLQGRERAATFASIKRWPIASG